MPYKFSLLMVAGILFLFAASGCAAQRKETGGISRLGYSIQVGAFKNVNNAQGLAAKLQAKGIDAFYFKKDDGVYAVRFGDFTSYATAKSNGNKLVNEKMIGSYFIADPRQVILAKAKDPELRQNKPQISGAKNLAGDMGDIAARTAERFVGIPYRWGGNTVVDGMDCSGFVRAVYNLCGVNIPRTSRDQFKAGDAVAKSNLLDGDLVFFGVSADEINHVGIYVGNGRFVHAPRRGDDIKVSLLSDNYFVQKFVGAKRYF